MTIKLTSNFFANARGVSFVDANGVTWAFNASTNQITASVSGAAGGTVTTVSVVTANGVSGAVATPTTTPAITLTLGAITPTSVAASGTVTGSNVSGTTSGTNTGDQVIPAAANPTAKVGTAAVNGVAATFMRSDGAPPIDLTFTPTWTGLHTFSAGVSISGATNPLLVQGGANQYTAIFTANSTSGQSLGLRVNAGTTTADVAFQVNSQSAGTTFFQIGGTGKASFNTAIGWNGVAPPAQVTGFGTPVGGAVVLSYNITDAGGASSNTNKCVAEILTILKAHGMIGA